MADTLPQLDRLFLSDSGLETDLIFNHGIELPHFASVVLAGSAEGRRALTDYYERHLAIARDAGTGFVLESATWRASPDWAERLGVDRDGLAALNRAAMALAAGLRAAWADVPTVLSGNVGPRGDGYAPDLAMTAEAAEDYHRWQTALLAASGAEVLTAMTLNTVAEAVGFTRAAAATGLPVVVSFTVETDGRLPSGDALGAAIMAVDAATGGAPAYYMINCAHPAHFGDVLDGNAAWAARVRGLRANASRASHAELDAMTELDTGDPAALAADYRALRGRFPGLTVLGGCCGTDHRHVAAIAEACTG